jgi:hypothetical protein
MQQKEQPFVYLEPWCSTAEQDLHFHETFLNQLKTEVGPDHVMFAVPVRMLARDGGSDDTLFGNAKGGTRAYWER